MAREENILYINVTKSTSSTEGASTPLPRRHLSPQNNYDSGACIIDIVCTLAAADSKSEALLFHVMKYSIWL